MADAYSIVDSPAGTLTQACSDLYAGASVVSLGVAAGPDAPAGGWIAVSGEDRVRWLNGMVTNSVQALTPGDGCYSFLLSAQGRIQGDATIWAEKDRLLLQTSVDQVKPMLAMLDRFIIMDDVELHDLSADSYGLLIAGLQAPETLLAVGIAARASRLLKRQNLTWRDRSIVLINAYSPLVPRFEIWSPEADSITGLHEALLQAGATACDEVSVELLRIAEGTARFRRDIRDRDLPQETAQTRALHFNKGCYLGQEIVERIRSRGNVHRTFISFVLHGVAPQPGTPLLADGKQVGELTSVASALIDGEQLALGFIRREALERNLTLTYEGGRAEPRVHAAAS